MTIFRVIKRRDAAREFPLESDQNSAPKSLECVRRGRCGTLTAFFQALAGKKLVSARCHAREREMRRLAH
jgi:hypothetical protein